MTNITDKQKRDVIVDAAKELFIRFGFSKTSMEEIAVQSGLAKPTLYYYYANKEAIFDEIVAAEAENFMIRIDDVLAKEIPADKKLALFYQTIYQNLKTYAAELSDLPETLCTHSPRGRPVIIKIHEMLLNKLGGLVAEGIESGAFAARDKEIYVPALKFMTNFMNLEWMREYPEDVRDRIVEAVIELILNGITRRVSS